VTIVSYGILPVGEIAALRQPSMAGVLEAAVGPWGAVFVSIGLIVAVLGAYLAWTLMAAEVMFVAAQDRDMPRFLARSRDDVPVNALLLSTSLSQVILLLTWLSADAFDFALDLTASMVLVPFFLAAAYALRLRLTRETYDGAAPGTLRADLVVAVLATAYTLFLVYAGGLGYLLVSLIIYAPATILFAMSRREQGRRVFSPGELALFVVLAAGAVLGVVGLAAGWIHL
jgi:arginine:ornithine antiporter/lysine permease